MGEQEITELQKRLVALDKGKNRNYWLQFFVFPLILAVLGYFFQNAIIESSERREQLKMAQDIVENVFTDTIYDKTIAMRGILYEVLDNDKLSRTIGRLIDTRLKELAINGTPKEMTKVVKAVETFSTATDSVKEKFAKSPEIQERIMNRNSLAKAKEKQAFTYLKNGELLKAERAFRQVDSIYPTYHQAYEISKYLRENSDKFDDKQDVLKIQEHTINAFPYGAPENIVKDIEREINEKRRRY